MKRKLFCSVLILLSYVCNAQPPVQFGPKAGINFATMIGKEVTGVKTLTSWHAGAVASFSFSKLFILQPELFYSQEGAQTGGLKYVISYLRLPLLFQLHHSSGFFVNGGPQFGLLVRGKAIYKDTDAEEDMKHILNKFETSLVMGIGYRLPEGLGIDLRYAAGLSNMGENSSIKLHTLSVGVSYLIGKK
ncbi:PorT family protein [Paraflavitalea soli]|uniref:PorT family protein n=1 Tax=Paraflavitalea soli TaxID=2315862 RepID=A0A3B7N1G5_9BACT|nr:porin family protein [Paraflavitalea soli]AXY77895.1 PorT family protein [Paraflavitalea soli]